jgi:hypothetical protein
MPLSTTSTMATADYAGFDDDDDNVDDGDGATGVGDDDNDRRRRRRQQRRLTLQPAGANKEGGWQTGR